MNAFLDIDMKFSIREIAKSASRALGAIYSKFLRAGGMNISVHTKVIVTKWNLCCFIAQAYGAIH